MLMDTTMRFYLFAPNFDFHLIIIDCWKYNMMGWKLKAASIAKIANKTTRNFLEGEKVVKSWLNILNIYG